MIILSVRTDKPEAEIGLFDDNMLLAYEVWTAHRQLAESLHAKIRDLLQENNKRQSDIEGIICYKGPGSFTGLRIGLTVANALAYALQVPIIGEEGGADKEWLQHGISRLQAGIMDVSVMPVYGADVHITLPKH